MTELHYIAPFANILSILEHGLLSHQGAQGLTHSDVADASVQARRQRLQIAGVDLHRYVCLYFHARNAMLYRLYTKEHQELAVLAVRPVVLDAAGAIISDRNAACGIARFYYSPAGLGVLDETFVFSREWGGDRDLKQLRQAEVLVPDRVDPGQILGAYVANAAAMARLSALVADRLRRRVDADLFFER